MRGLMITREELLAEQASLDQQEGKARADLAAVLGAKQIIAHLLSKIDEKENPKPPEEAK